MIEEREDCKILINHFSNKRNLKEKSSLKYIEVYE